MGKFIVAQTLRAEGVLLGRRTYQIFAAPALAGPSDVAAGLICLSFLGALLGRDRVRPLCIGLHKVKGTRWPLGALPEREEA
jgi:hypothetical protein